MVPGDGIGREIHGGTLPAAEALDRRYQRSLRQHTPELGAAMLFEPIGTTRGMAQWCGAAASFRAIDQNLESAATRTEASAAHSERQHFGAAAARSLAKPRERTGHPAR